MTTEKENYLKVLRGEQPEWVPNYLDAIALCMPVVYENKVIPGSGNPNKKFKDIFGIEHEDREKYTDMLGIEWTQTIDGQIPTPGKHLITDITKWREQVNYPFPDLDKIDFKTQAEGYYSVVDHNQKAVVCLVFGRYEMLMDLMGVDNALCALIEEPEAVHDFFTEFTNFQEKTLRVSFPYYKPDVVLIPDDVATVKDLFMSPEIYTKMVAPYVRQIAKAAVELGAIAEMHCCGKCEKLIPQWIDMGITVWQPAQAVNDLKAIKEKYGHKIVLNGGWDTNGPGAMTGAPEEVVRQSVRDAIDKLAPGGGYVFWDTGMTGGDFEKFGWTADEARKYGKEFYKKHSQESI